jgi:hypothetical protein
MSWRGWRVSCAGRTPGFGRRTRSRRLSWSGCALTWRFCSGWCSGGRRSGRGRGLRAVMVTPAVAGSRAGPAARVAGAALGGRAGRRDYSHLPRFKVVWDFPGGGYCCPECGMPFTLLGDHVAEQLDWLVIVRVRADCRRRYRRACDCRVPATVMAPGPPKAIGKGFFL